MWASGANRAASATRLTTESALRRGFRCARDHARQGARSSFATTIDPKKAHGLRFARHSGVGAIQEGRAEAAIEGILTSSSAASRIDIKAEDPRGR